mgnify:FL=1
MPPSDWSCPRFSGHSGGCGLSCDELAWRYIYSCKRKTYLPNRKMRLQGQPTTASTTPFFLQSRDMMRQFDSKWSSLPHASYPDLLNGQIKKTFKAERRRAEKSGDKELTRSIDKAIFAIGKLREIFLSSNGTRAIADYEPEEAIVFTANDKYSLRNIDVTEARGWSTQTDIHCQTILRSWNQSNVQ